jgi:chorismate mutase/prephenate dehydratase
MIEMRKHMDLKALRNEIDKIDQELVKLFEKRLDLVKEVKKYKQEHQLPILDKNREQEVISKNLEYLNNKDYQEYLEEYMQSIMDIAKKSQK